MGCVIGDEIIERDKRDLFLCDHSYLDEQYKGTCCFFRPKLMRGGNIWQVIFCFLNLLSCFNFDKLL